MQYIDLPDYLKNSRLLNNLTIRELLQYWAVVCAFAVIFLSIVALVTNDITSKKQLELDEKYIPIGNIARNLESILADLDLRKKQMLEAGNLSRQEFTSSRQSSKEQVDQNLVSLSRVVTNEIGLEYAVPRLQSRFDDYFVLEDAFYNSLANPELGGQLNQTDHLSNLEECVNELRSILNRLSTIVFDRIRLLTDETYDLGQFNLMIIVIVSLLVISVIVAGISMVIFRIDRPLVDLTTAMDELSSGDMSRRMEVKETVKDEFANLAADFNLFAQRLQDLFEDVTEARDALQSSEQLTRAILENALVGIVYEKDGKLIAVNEKFEDLFGYMRNEILGNEMEMLFLNKKDVKTINDVTEPLLSSGNTYRGEWQMKDNKGHPFWCDVSANTISEEGPGEGVIWLFEDITQRKSQGEELLKLANFDTLTGLPNRSLFMDRLEQGINRSQRRNRLLGLLYIDLDRFKTVNDSLGHTTGDELLKIVAGRLCECVRGSDTVCRLGGDEFTIVVPEIQDISVAGKVAEKVITVMDDPVKLAGEELNITPSIGVSIFPDDAIDMESLMKNADSAMYHAKSKGRNTYQYYTQTMNAEARIRLDRENKLRRAVENHQFRLFYQPQVDVDNLVISGYEALIRWQETDNKIVSPDEFVPLLEDSGLIVRVGEWILLQACRDIAEISSRNSHFRTVSINLSARQFMDDTLVDKIRNIITESKISPEQVVIEITESVMMTETKRSLHILTQLSEMGLKLSLDDFGTGYSSLAYLRQFPIDVIKIDKSFVHGLQVNDSDAAICEAIITIAKQLGLKVVAEGVENESQFDYMRQKGCHVIQGYYFGKPAPLDTLLSKVH